MLKMYFQKVRGNEEIGRLVAQNTNTKQTDVFSLSEGGQDPGPQG